MDEVKELLVKDYASLDSLMKKAKDIQDKCKDYTITKANSNNLWYDADSLKLIYEPKEDKIRKVDISRHALSQLCNKIGVPVRYIEKCTENGMLELASDNINSWVDEFNKSLFIREYDNKIRGVLSDKYSVLDTPDIITCISDSIKESEYDIKGHFLTPERFHARFTQKEKMKVNGEDLFGGFQVDSSDVGRSVLTVKFFIYKQVCTNGLCIAKGGGMLFEQKHIGIDSINFYANLTKSMGTIPDLVTHAEEVIRLANTTNITYKKAFSSQSDLENLVNSIRVNTKLSEEGALKVVDTMKNVYTPSKWGLVNAITQVAQDYSLERRLELESIAGNILMASWQKYRVVLYYFCTYILTEKEGNNASTEVI